MTKLQAARAGNWAPYSNGMEICVVSMACLGSCRMQRGSEILLTEFRRKGSKDGIGMLRTASERTVEIHEELRDCFIAW